MLQNEAYRDQATRMEIARRIVDNKIRNQKRLIEEYRWDNEYSWKEDIQGLERLLEKLPGKDTSSAVMGIEGAASNIYFKSFSHMFRCDIRFPGRNRRPPRDPINVILSLGYTLLTRDVESALEAESFETYLGFLHGVRYGRKSLPLDIVEEFRQPVIDRLVLRLFNKGILKAYDFETGEQGLPTLSSEGFRKFCTMYEKWMTGQDHASGDRSFRQRIRRQAAGLKYSLKDSRLYEPFSWGEGRTECT